MLAIDTANSYLALAFVDESNREFIYKSIDQNSQAETICHQVDLMLQQANKQIGEINTFGVNLGPGSFTGLRVGISYLAGLIAFNKNANIIEFDTFDIAFYDFFIHNDISCHRNIAILLKADAKNGIFLKRYDTFGNVIQEEEYHPNPPQDLLESDLILAENSLLPNINYPNIRVCQKVSAQAMNEIMKNRFKQAKKMSDIKILRPKYLRQPY